MTTLPRTMHRRVLSAATMLLPFAFAGCQTAMSTPSPDPVTAPASRSIKPNEFPLRFKAHNFGAYCYSALECVVHYAGRTIKDEQTSQKPSPPRTEDDLNNWNAPYLGIPNFPGPATVRWRSLDGREHETSVDIGAIFADELIRHRVAEADVPPGWAHDIRPDIFVEVNDRTVSVYTKTHVATKALQEPGNRYSDFREDMFKVWSKTF